MEKKLQMSGESKVLECEYIMSVIERGVFSGSRRRVPCMW